MAVFGVLAAALGAVGLVSPAAQLSLLGLAAPGERAAGDLTPAFMTASSMAALNMGVYYVLAALADWRAFFRWTVPFRLLTCTFFTVAALGERAPRAGREGAGCLRRCGPVGGSGRARDGCGAAL